MANRPFVRVYHDDFMRDYPTVYSDNDALSTWLRLLILIDKMWPAPPDLPRWVKPRPLAVLTDSKLVKLIPPHGYSIRGYESERQTRNDAARNAAAVRWQSKGNADGNADAMPNARAPVPVPVPSTSTKEDVLNAREGRKNDRRGGSPELASEIALRALRGTQ